MCMTRAGVDWEGEVWHPAWHTPTQTHAQTATVCLAGDGTGARRPDMGGGAGCEMSHKSMIQVHTQGIQCTKVHVVCSKRHRCDVNSLP